MRSETGSVSPDISVILAAMNEELTVGLCIRQIQNTFQENNLKGEIILSDSSTDRTPEIARSLGATVIHPRNKGYGNAYLEAFSHAKGDIIVIGDADGTYDFMEIPRLIKPLSEGADLVIGSRFMGQIMKDSMPALHYYVGNPLLRKILNLTFHTSFSDPHSGFRAMKRQVWEELKMKSGGMEFASEMLIMSSIKGLRITEVPISYHTRIAPSKLHSFADGWRHLRFILLIRPIPFLAVPGLIFSGLGAMLMCMFSLFDEVNRLHLHSFTLSAFLFIGGIQVLLTAGTIKTYSVVHGYDRKEGVAKVLMNYHNLEKLLILGGILIVIGILLGWGIVTDWVSSGYGVLTRFSDAVTALLLAIVGLQVILASIFISMMLLNESPEPGE